MEYQYNEAVWGPAWIWAFGLIVFLSGLVLTVWFLQMARGADENDTPPRQIPRDISRDIPRDITRGGPGATGHPS